MDQELIGGDAMAIGFADTDEAHELNNLSVVQCRFLLLSVLHGYFAYLDDLLGLTRSDVQKGIGVMYLKQKSLILMKYRFQALDSSDVITDMT